MSLNKSFLDYIHVYDNILEDEQLETLRYYSSEHKWGFQTSNPSIKDVKNVFLFMHIKQDLVIKNIKQTLNKKINYENFDDYKIERIYLNAQFSGMHGQPHTDSVTDGDLTLIVYLNRNWNYLWGGQTFFFDSYVDIKTKEPVKNSNRFKSFFPTWNTGLLFPGNMYHFAESPTTLAEELRLSLAIKFTKRNGFLV